MFLLDTNSCIRFLNGRSERIRQNIEKHKPNDIVVCSIVKAELYFGAVKSKQRDRNLGEQKMFMSRFVSLPFDDTCAETYSTIRAELELSGTPIGPNDLMIAAIAITHDATLITHNTREFIRIKTLKIEDWEV